MVDELRDRQVARSCVGGATLAPPCRRNGAQLRTEKRAKKAELALKREKRERERHQSEVSCARMLSCATSQMSRHASPADQVRVLHDKLSALEELKAQLAVKPAPSQRRQRPCPSLRVMHAAACASASPIGVLLRYPRAAREGARSSHGAVGSARRRWCSMRRPNAHGSHTS
jgi:hypothetical protein